MLLLAPGSAGSHVLTMTSSNNAILFRIPNLCKTCPLEDEDRPSPESIPYGIAPPSPPPTALQSAFLAEEKLSKRPFLCPLEFC